VRGKSLRNLTVASAAALAAAYALVFLVTPLDADQGLIQKIFYVHVPLAIVSLGGFVLGAIAGLRYLRTGDPTWDLRSYVSIHISLVFAVATLVTGSVWARAAWGHWWVWNEPTLVSFLIIFLLYCTYQPLRFAIEDPARQARIAAVFAVIAGAFVPLNFIAVRLAQPFSHPRVLSATGGNMPGSMRLAFLVALAAIALVYVTLWRLEIASKLASLEIRRLRRRLEAALGPEPTPTPQQIERDLAEVA
jgi:heme exporter protein C